MVEMKLVGNMLLEYRDKRDVLPTAESPMMIKWMDGVGWRLEFVLDLFDMVGVGVSSGRGGRVWAGYGGGSRELLGLDNCLAFVHDKRPRGEMCRPHWRVNCVVRCKSMSAGRKEGSIFRKIFSQ